MSIISKRTLSTFALTTCLAAVGATLPVVAKEPIHPIPKAVEVDQRKVSLGRKLFSDVRLSSDNSISCATCHVLSKGGADGRAVSIGVGGAKGVINAPTVYNSALNIRQFWDGRAADLKVQVDGPVQTKFEMDSIWTDIVAKLYKDAAYPAEFKAVYPEGITRESIKDAVAEFERSLITPNSPFDRWLQGEENAISATEKRGYQKFKQYGCISCHQGQNVGGNLFQVFGVLNSYFQQRGNLTEADLGRYNVTGNDADKHAFKVPSLRMAAYTAPYLHDGSAKSLRDAVDIMFKYQLGRTAPDKDKDEIVAFIKSLAGELQPD